MQTENEVLDETNNTLRILSLTTSPTSRDIVGRCRKEKKVLTNVMLVCMLYFHISNPRYDNVDLMMELDVNLRSSKLCRYLTGGIQKH